MTENTVHISAFYHFANIANHAAYREKLRSFLLFHHVRGTVLLAPEGINGTISGSESAVDAALDWMRREIPDCSELTEKRSHYHKHAFRRLKVKVKEWVLPFPESVDPAICVGTYVSPQKWNALIDDEYTIVIDTRNDYEVKLGSFKGAINPKTRTFKEMLAFTREELAEAKDKNIAMFCTGGIRCEKYSSFLMQEGFEKVYHLQGGILQYLSDIPESQSRWEGECFVFDDRIAVGHGMEVSGDITMCYACGHPLTPEDRANEAYELLKSCSHCTHQKQARYWETMRAKDIEG